MLDDVDAQAFWIASRRLRHRGSISPAQLRESGAEFSRVLTLLARRAGGGRAEAGERAQVAAESLLKQLPTIRALDLPEPDGPRAYVGYVKKVLMYAGSSQDTAPHDSESATMDSGASDDGDGAHAHDGTEPGGLPGIPAECLCTHVAKYAIQRWPKLQLNFLLWLHTQCACGTVNQMTYAEAARHFGVRGVVQNESGDGVRARVIRCRKKMAAAAWELACKDHLADEEREALMALADRIEQGRRCSPCE